MDSTSDPGPIARALSAKRNEDGRLDVTGLKLMVFGVELTLIGGFVPDLGLLVVGGGLVCLLGAAVA